MLYGKLILRNLKRSMKEYMIFMITMCISSMLLYSFNCILLSEELQIQMVASSGISEMFVTISIIMVIIFAWLVSYISKFMLKHRSKEFGLYLLSGMKRKAVANMFVIEMFAMGLIAFFIGSILGVCFYQILEAIIMKTFTMNYQLEMTISSDTLALSFIYYVMMWVLTLLRQRRSIMKVKIRSLLYQDDQNESIKRSRLLIAFQFLIFIATFIVGIRFFKEGFVQLSQSTGDSPGLLMMQGIALLIISVYAFYFVISNGLQGFFHKFKKLKYQGSNLLLYGHVMGRLSSNRIVLGTLSLITVISLMMITFTIQFKDMVEETSKYMYPYDIQITGYDETYQNSLNIEFIQNSLKEQGYAVEDTVIKLYAEGEIKSALAIKTNINDAFQNQEQESYSEGTYMRESDFRQLLKLKQEELPQPLQKDEFGISLNVMYSSTIESSIRSFLPKLTLSIDEVSLQRTFVSDVQVGQYYQPIIFILPDEILQEVQGGLEQYIANTQPEPELGLTQLLLERGIGDGRYFTIRISTDDIRESLVSYLYMSFVLLYLAFVFICVQATILATQQMMDVEKNRYTYQTLRKLGMKKQEINSLLFRQIGIYFIIPLLLPIVYALPLLSTMDILFQNVVTTLNVYVVFFAALALYLVVYLCYFLLAYIGCKRNLQKDG